MAVPLSSCATVALSYIDHPTNPILYRSNSMYKNCVLAANAHSLWSIKASALNVAYLYRSPFSKTTSKINLFVVRSQAKSSSNKRGSKNKGFGGTEVDKNKINEQEISPETFKSSVFIEDVDNKSATASLDDLSFEKRLAEIKQSVPQRLKEKETINLGPIDYDAPAKSSNADTNESGSWTQNSGAKIAIAAGAIFFAFIFAFGDIFPAGVPIQNPNTESSNTELSEKEKSVLKSQIDEFEEKLKNSPDSREAIEGLAVSYAEFGDYKKSETYLERLLKDYPNDVDVLRLSAEIKFELRDFGASAELYRQALRVSSNDSISLLTGLTNSLIAENKYSDAVGEVLAAKKRAEQKRLDALTENDAAASESTSSPDPIQLDLLLGKTYYGWKKVGDAIAVYDSLISQYPNDFRPYLAKAILLQDQGKKGDAERMFVQAKYFAPKNAKFLVDKYAGREN